MTTTKWVDVDGQHRFQGAVFSKAYLQGDPEEHVNVAGFKLVALERQQHPLPPARVEPVVQSDVIAYKHGVNADPAVFLLQKVAQLHVLEVRLETDVVVRRVRYGVPTGPLAQHVAGIATGTPGAVLVGARGTMRTVAHGTRNDALTGRVLVVTRAGPRFFHVGADLIVLTAVHDGEDVSQPIAKRPTVKEGSEEGRKECDKSDCLESYK